MTYIYISYYKKLDIYQNFLYFYIMDLKLRSGFTVPQKVIDDFGDRLFPTKMEIKKVVRIKWYGEYVVVPNGKSGWPSIGAAKNAVHNAVKSYVYLQELFSEITGQSYCATLHYRGIDGLYNDFFNTLIDNGILEFEEQSINMKTNTNEE